MSNLINECEQAKRLWNKLENDLMYEYRFFLESDFLEIIKKIIVNSIKVISPNSEFFRARIYKDFKYDDKVNKAPFWGYDAENSFINKNSDIVDGGRANPKFITYLYMALTNYTACIEVRPSIKDIVSIATIINTQELTLVDFSQIHFVSNFKDQVLFLINQAFSTPAKANQKEYIITQYLSEFIKKQGFDGIMFNSSLDRDGTNITVFNASKCKVVSSELYQVNNINLDIDKLLPKDSIATDKNSEKDTLVIVGEDGNEITVEIIAIFNSEITGHDYIIYTNLRNNNETQPAVFKNEDDEIIINISKLIKKDGIYSFGSIDDNEWGIVQDYLDEIIESSKND